MTDFSVKIIGCGSATPTPRHNPSGQVVCHNGRLFMVDCGEGAQLQMRRMGVSFARVRHIFISHMHGDHILGLPGLLSTLSLHNIDGDVHVYTFSEGIEWLKSFFKVTMSHPTINIVYHEVECRRQVVYEDRTLTVETFPLHHRVPCVGYIFREKPKLRKIRGDMVEFYGVPQYQRESLRHGTDFVRADGEVVPNSRLTSDPDPALSYAYCSDTMYSKDTIADVTGVTTIYHESTYTKENAQKARDRGHSTAQQAAMVAREAGAHQLILGHYSNSYTDDRVFLREAEAELEGTGIRVEIASEGMDIPII